MNEGRVVDKLQSATSCCNLITVLKHGWLIDIWCYFIDMKLCQGNLEHYIKGAKLLTYEEITNPRFFGAALPEQRGPWHIWNIMEQVANGVGFIHSHKFVHRDLKPSNGRPFLTNSND
jgi:serine/threonine protein kinase